jgi:hypothetical protein
VVFQAALLSTETVLPLQVFEETINPPLIVVQLALGGGPSFALLKLSKTGVVGNATK